jgi:hypothetical protein
MSYLQRFTASDLVPEGLTEDQKLALEDAQMDSYQDMPTRLEMAISLFTRTATSDGQANLHARSVRIPSIENITIDALAKYSGLSANKVIVQLLEVALDEVFQGFTDKQRGEVFAIRGQMMKDMIPAGSTSGIPEFGGESSAEGEI